ncbi:MAG: lipoyl synthase [Acidobacteria bacterium]|nr:MAG: lipoyl synthase [Acidobacteriota bacterium]TDI48026.1 MAG: lipoyl synthase [Acidobacteriota bacterium]
MGSPNSGTELPTASSGQEGRVPKPPWLRIRLRTGPEFRAINSMMSDLSLSTVCQEARCPNIYECWNERTATLMILGETCTRRCSFCSVASGLPPAPDAEEPGRVAEAVSRMGLRHAVLTSVDRDDLPDGGAAHWAAVMRAVRKANPRTRLEVLVPDFKGKGQALEQVLDQRPDVFAHNVETVPRLYRTVRPGSGYEHSLAVLTQAAARRDHWPLRVKSNLMLGLGETREEILETMSEIHAHGAEILTIGQYLQPTAEQQPVARYAHPDEFKALARAGREMGYWHVEAGPLVRSSYHAANHRPEDLTS